jgi:hypothetical protein
MVVVIEVAVKVRVRAQNKEDEISPTSRIQNRLGHNLYRIFCHDFVWDSTLCLQGMAA